MRLRLDEITQLFGFMNERASAIARGRAALRGIHGELDERAQNPFEQDLIYERQFGSRPSAPRERTVHGISITTHVLHQEGVGLSDIVGGDLLYEIPESKYAVIQYKQERNGRFAADHEQLDTLVASCPSHCNSALLGALWCGSWVGLLSPSGDTILPACAARSVFSTRSSASASDFRRAISHQAFDELFAKCFAGARTAFAPIDVVAAASFRANRLLFYVREAP